MNFIAGAWQPVSRTHPRENPANPSETVGVYPVSGKEDALTAFDAAAEGFHVWKQTPIIQRARVLQQAARILEQRQAEIARDMAREVGKPIGESTDEVRRSGDLLDYYASFVWQPEGHLVPVGRQVTNLRSKLSEVL